MESQLFVTYKEEAIEKPKNVLHIALTINRRFLSNKLGNSVNKINFSKL